MIHYEVLSDLIEVKTAHNKTLLHDLVDMFIQQTPDRLRKIDSAIKEKNKDQILRIAHALKASCGYLGAGQMTGLCSELEEMGKSEDSLNSTTASIWLSALEESYEESSSELRNYIKDRFH